MNIIKKILLPIVLIAIIAINIQRVFNESKENFTLKDLLCLNFANAEDIGKGCPCTPYDFDNKLLYLKTCVPLFWQQKLKCDDAATNKCCRASDQKACSGGPLNFPPDYNWM